MRSLLILCCTALAWAQSTGTTPKPSAADYEVHAQGKHAAIGAEFMIHSFSGQGQMYFINDFLVVEVALYPPRDGSVTVNEGEFQLRINRSRKTIVPSPPSMVASLLQHPEWRSGPRLEGGAGAGPAGVIFGRPRPTQIPGAPEPRTPPNAPRVPGADPPGGITREPPIRADELALKAALPQGAHRGAVSGYLYFPYKGKASKIKSAELLYDDTVLKLR